jgi:chorismate mutase
MNTAAAANDLQRTRKLLARTDSRLHALLARRIRLSVRASDLAARGGLSHEGAEKEALVLARSRAYAVTHGLDPVTFAYAIDAVLELCHFAQQAHLVGGAGDSP